MPAETDKNFGLYRRHKGRSSSSDSGDAAAHKQHATLASFTARDGSGDDVHPRLHRDGTFSCAFGKLDKVEVQEAQEDFIEYDTDGDGIISITDFQVAMTKHDPSWARAGRRATLESMFAAVDRDGDGKVCFEDFAVMKVQKKLALGLTQAAYVPPVQSLTDGFRRAMRLSVHGSPTLDPGDGSPRSESESEQSCQSSSSGSCASTITM